MNRSISDFGAKKRHGEKIAMLTCYDFPTSRIESGSGVDILLVGDSLGTNVLGYTSVSEVTLDDMVHHLRAVRRGASEKPILCDMPFGTYSDHERALYTARVLLENGADGIKVEGEREVLTIVRDLVANGISVCGHVGYTPQTRGDKASVQGKDLARATEILSAAIELDRAGVDMIVLELIPEELGAEITRRTLCPTIGIGAGRFCDGQVQVVYDILGVSERVFKHSQTFGKVGESMQNAIAAYSDSVHSGVFPAEKNSASLSEETRTALQEWARDNLIQQ